MQYRITDVTHISYMIMKTYVVEQNAFTDPLVISDNLIYTM